MFRFIFLFPFFPLPLCFSRYKKAKKFTVSRSNKKFQQFFFYFRENKISLFTQKCIYIFLLFFFNIKKIIIPVFPGDAKNPQVKQKISNSSVRSLLYKSFIRSYSHHTNKEMSRTLIIPEFPPIVSTSKDEIRRDCERKISIVSLAS